MMCFGFILANFFADGYNEGTVLHLLVEDLVGVINEGDDRRQNEEEE